MRHKKVKTIRSKRKGILYQMKGNVGVMFWTHFILKINFFYLNLLYHFIAPLLLYRVHFIFPNLISVCLSYMSKPMECHVEKSIISRIGFYSSLIEKRLPETFMSYKGRASSIDDIIKQRLNMVFLLKAWSFWHKWCSMLKNLIKIEPRWSTSNN